MPVSDGDKHHSLLARNYLWLEKFFKILSAPALTTHIFLLLDPSFRFLLSRSPPRRGGRRRRRSRDDGRQALPGHQVHADDAGGIRHPRHSRNLHSFRWCTSAERDQGRMFIKLFCREVLLKGMAQYG
jgi:hypothetical protein